MFRFVAIICFGCALAAGRDCGTTANDFNSSVSSNIGTLSKKKCLELYPEIPQQSERSVLGIAGGVKSLPEEFPHMAALGITEKAENNTTTISWACGGSLISRQFVLTAAHCLRNTAIDLIRLGDLDLEDDTDPAEPQTIGVKRTILHPEYAYPHKYHDIALIELEKPIRRTVYVTPACLYTEKEVPKEMTATGWGKTAYVGRYSSHLLKVDLNHVEHNNCSGHYQNQERYLPEGVREDVQICAGDVKEKDTCFGDSGGPLQIKKPDDFSAIYNVHDVVGVTSFGKACALSSTPAVFTRVSNYLPWIESIVWPNEPSKHQRSGNDRPFNTPPYIEVKGHRRRLVKAPLRLGHCGRQAAARRFQSLALPKADNQPL